MKLDDDLLREILLRIEATPAGELLESREIEALGHSEPSIFEHITLLEEAGYLVLHAHVRGGYTIERLTMDGHTYLSNIREPKRWNKVKAAAGGLGLAILAKVAAEIATRQAMDAIE
ncbi:MAG: DUF2513 domain-containing protein [Planctomycetota bacterium]